MILVGFLEYAWNISFEKDHLRTKILVAEENDYPQLFQDKTSFAVILPVPKIMEETISFMGYEFPADDQSKQHVIRLFRATVFHLSAHVVSSNFEDYLKWKNGKNRNLTKFVASVIEDVEANAYISALHPDKTVDLAFANALAIKRSRPINKILNPATRIMASLLIYANTGLKKPTNENEQKTINHLIGDLERLKEMMLASFVKDKADLRETKLEVADEIYSLIEGIGPVTELPSLPHTERLGSCSLFPAYKVESEDNLGTVFEECLTALGGSSRDNSHQTWEKIAEAEALQVFDSWFRQKEKKEKILKRYENFLFSTRFKSVEFPMQDYTEYLRIKSRCKSEAHRLIESLLVARDALDEDPRKMYGVLDLQEVIQVIASKSPRMDVFMLDENISKSYSWIILLDASKSMGHVGDYALDIAVILAETAKELLIDPTSWGMYAFNDRFYIIKDLPERYNVRVKSRIGGIRFEGATYMPDALKIAGLLLKGRAENLRLVTIVSDGWPYGYPNIRQALAKSVDALEKAQVIIIGIGAKTRRMEFFFKSNCTAYTLRDVVKKFSYLYLDASRSAVGL